MTRGNESGGHRRRKRGDNSLLVPGVVLTALTLAVVVAVGVVGYRVAAARRKPAAPQSGATPVVAVPQRDGAARPEDLLIGRWVGRHPEGPGREVRYEFARGGAFTLTAAHPGLGTVTVRGTWRVVSSGGNTLRLSMRTESREVVADPGNQVRPAPEDGPREYEQQVELTSADHFRLTTNTGRVVEAARHP